MKKYIKKIGTFILGMAVTLSIPINSFAANGSSATGKDTSNDESTSIISSASNGPSSFTWPVKPTIDSKSAIVMDASTGSVLYSKDSDTKKFPASITKIMTAMLALDNLKLDDPVIFSASSIYSLPYGSANIARQVGDELSVKDCLYSMMLHSSNEVATALGEKISGNIDSFAKLMTSKAAELGCKDTNFTNANGLHDDNHYTTAYDMALITKQAITNKDFVEISGTKSYTIPASSNSESLSINNKDELLLSDSTNYDSRVICGKTGYTDEANNTLVTVAKNNDLTLIVVTLDCVAGKIYNDTSALLNYGFDNFTRIDVADNETRTFTSNGMAYEIPSDSYMVVPINMPLNTASTSVSADDNGIVTLHYGYENYTIGNIPLIATDPITEPSDKNSELSTILIGSGEAVVPQSKTFINIIWTIIKIIFYSILTLIIIVGCLFARKQILMNKRRKNRLIHNSVKK